VTRLVNDPANFSDEALEGFVAANHRYVRRVHGGVVRSTRTPDGEVGLVIGGGAGHYPAFSGWVGVGLAHGAACGNVFASPAASQVYSVIKAADHGAGVLVSFGNYAGDVLNFGRAADRLRAEGVDVRLLAVTDDLASAPVDRVETRRGIAGDLTVFKVAGAAAEAGLSLNEVERVAVKANASTRTIGVAFSGCSLPGADHPLFTVPPGRMGVGLGIHGETGIDEMPMGSADDIARLLFDRVNAEAPPDDRRHVAVLVNGLGTVKYEELFVVYRKVAELLADRGYAVIDPVVGEQCTSLDMAGLSLTLMWLDEELERLWTAPADAPAYRKGVGEARELVAEDFGVELIEAVVSGSTASRSLAAKITEGLLIAEDVLVRNEARLGDIDAIAGDGDHGIGMVRGVRAAVESARASLAAEAGARTLVMRAGDAWSEKAGGTSGALWGVALNAVGACLDDQRASERETLISAVHAAIGAMVQLGGAELGDKTMIDAAVPFAESLSQQRAASLRAAWQTAAFICQEAAEKTADIPAKRGRARVHAEKSIGTPDPGAISFAMLMAAMTDMFGDE